MSYISDDFVYTILVNEDNTMTTTHKKRIVQRSKLVDDLWFLAAPKYNGYNMAEFTVVLEYLLPVSRRYKNEILSLSSSNYNGYLKYTLPIDTELTAEAGEIELMLTFIMSTLDEFGKSVQRVRKISGTSITVTPISAWSDIIPDSALTALDQRIIKTDAQLRAISELADTYYYSKADDLKYDGENSTLQLMAAGKEIGKKVVLNLDESVLDDGVPVVAFNHSNDSPSDEEQLTDVVLF